MITWRAWHCRESILVSLDGRGSCSSPSLCSNARPLNGIWYCHMSPAAWDIRCGNSEVRVRLLIQSTPRSAETAQPSFAPSRNRPRSRVVWNADTFTSASWPARSTKPRSAMFLLGLASSAALLRLYCGHSVELPSPVLTQSTDSRQDTVTSSSARLKSSHTLRHFRQSSRFAGRRDACQPFYSLAAGRCFRVMVS